MLNYMTLVGLKLSKTHFLKCNKNRPYLYFFVLNSYNQIKTE